MATNRLEEKSGYRGSLTLYDDDDVTVIETWELLDEAGGPVLPAIGTPAKRSAASPEILIFYSNTNIALPRTQDIVCSPRRENMSVGFLALAGAVGVGQLAVSFGLGPESKAQPVVSLYQNKGGGFAYRNWQEYEDAILGRIRKGATLGNNSNETVANENLLA